MNTSAEILVREEPKYGEIYHHFKGNDYFIIDVAKHTEECYKLVIYRNTKGEVFARPIDMFLSKVDKVKYPDAKQEFRFERVEYNEVIKEEVSETVIDDLKHKGYKIIEPKKEKTLVKLNNHITLKSLKDIFEKLHLPIDTKIVIVDGEDFENDISDIDMEVDVYSTDFLVHVKGDDAVYIVIEGYN